MKNQSELKREHRFVPARELRVARNAAGAPVVSGYAAVFSSLSQDLGGFREQIMPGAFTTSLAGQPDVRALFNHDPNLVLGRTKAGTLELAEDGTGLQWSATLPDTTVARDLAISVERGDIDQCSFGFYCLDDDWSMDNSGGIVRSVKKAELFDVSVVTYPAYEATSASIRALYEKPEHVEHAIRSLLAPKHCACEACREDNCDGCSVPDADQECSCNDLRNLKARLRLVESSL